MKRTLVGLSCTLAIGLSLGACASVPDTGNQELQFYRAHAGAKVYSFNYLGHMDSWKALDSSTIALWTRPNEAWLIDLVGICNNLEYTPAIGIPRNVGQVRTGSRILVHDPSGIENPCYIQSIRPLDANAIREGDKQKHGAAESPPAG
jgi:hypothetical protein